MLTKTVEYLVESGDAEGEATVIRLVVSQATVLMGMKRAVLQGSAESWVASRRAEALADIEGDADAEGKGEGGSDDDPASGNGHRIGMLTLMAGSLAARILYPDLIACTVEADGLDAEALTVESFLELPDQLTGAWEAAVYALNPHWLPGPKPETKQEADAEKKG